MGNKKLNYFLLLLIVIFAVTLAILQNLDEPEKPKLTPSEPQPHIIKSVIVRVTPVDGEPGAYVLEYDNGYVEVVHADGSREQLQLDKLPEDTHVQPVRPSATAGERPGTHGSPD